MSVRIVRQRTIAVKLAVLDLDRIARDADYALDKVLGRIGREHKHYYVAPMYRLELEDVMPPRNFICKRRQSKKRIGQTQAVDKFVDDDMVADQQRRLHRARGYLVGLQEEGAQDYRERQRDDERLRVLARGRLLRRL